MSKIEKKDWKALFEGRVVKISSGEEYLVKNITVMGLKSFSADFHTNYNCNKLRIQRLNHHDTTYRRSFRTIWNNPDESCILH